MKYATDLNFAFTPRVLVDTVGRKTFDHRLTGTCLEEIHERGHILEVLNDIQSHSSEFIVHIIEGLGFATRRNFVQQVGEVFNEFAIDHISAAFKLEQKFSPHLDRRRSPQIIFPEPFIAGIFARYYLADSCSIDDVFLTFGLLGY